MSHALEQSRAERISSAGPTLLAAALEQCREAVALTDGQGRFLYVNNAYAALHGYAPEDLVGQPLSVVEVDSEAGSLSLVIDALGRDRQFVGEVWHRRRDGHCFVTHAHVTGLCLPGEPVSGAIWIHHGMEYLEHAYRQNAILEGINQVFRETLTCESERDVASACLRVAERLTGSQAGFIMELDESGRMSTLAMTDLGWDACRMPEDQAIRMLSNMEPRGLFGLPIKTGQSVISNDPSAHPASVGLPEGHPALRAVLCAPLPHGNRIFGVICLGNKPGGYDAQDLQAVEALARPFVETLLRFRTERQLQRSLRELRQSNHDLEQFASAVSHDLQEPLRAIAGNLQLLERRYTGELGQDGDRCIQFAVDGAKRLRGLIDALLTYSRVGTRGRPLEPTDAGIVLANVLKGLRGAIEESGATVVRDTLPTVMADPDQLTHVFQNLIANAIKFCGDKPPQVQVSAEQDNEEWVFTVRDTGIGIEEQYHERIFEMFQRLHSHSQYPGNGIGLPLCRRIVERHGGRIWVESRPGEETVFRFTLAACREIKSSSKRSTHYANPA